jgi:hypothetical protein
VYELDTDSLDKAEWDDWDVVKAYVPDAKANEECWVYKTLKLPAKKCVIKSALYTDAGSATGVKKVVGYAQLWKAPRARSNTVKIAKKMKMPLEEVERIAHDVGGVLRMCAVLNEHVNAKIAAVASQDTNHVSIVDKLSDETKDMLREGLGYRDDTVFGDGIRDVAAVSIYETLELRNSDIPETILKLYDEFLTEDERNLLKMYLCVQDPEVDLDCIVLNQKKLGDIALSVAQRVTGNPNPTCVWLAAYDTVSQYYKQGESDEGTIDAYAVNEDMCILADLGYDGALFAY